MPVPTVDWVGGLDGSFKVIDQTLLPTRYEIIDLDTVEQAWEAIRKLRVRGAPALGVAAGFSVVVGVRNWTGSDPEKFLAEVERVCLYIGTSRPTAVNLFWALDRMRRCAQIHRAQSVPAIKQALLDEAKLILAEDKDICRRLGAHAVKLIHDGAHILTHCNAGGLATADFGTALAGIFTAHEAGLSVHVYVDETRPLLQGSRLTAWELMNAGIETTLICDNMAGFVLSRGEVDLVITGADRIAANGDTANKIGTYGLAVLACHHRVPFYVAAPVSTFDLAIRSGAEIPIEQRAASEVTDLCGVRLAPEGVGVLNPAFDVTPHELITGIITELGVISHPDVATVSALLGKRS